VALSYEQAIAEVQQIVGWRSDKVAESGNALRYAQSQREQPGATYPWFLEQVKTLTIVAGTVNYPLPTGYIQDSEQRDGNLYYDLGTTLKSRPVFLKKWSFQDLLQKYLGVWPSSSSSATSNVAPAGNPSDYCLDMSQVYLYPIPDGKVTSINWACWAADTVLTTGVVNLWLTNAPWVLIGEAAQKIASDLKYADGVSAAQTILARANTDLFNATIHRQEAGRKRAMGSRL
jgi:hypothetical protein